MARGRWDSEKRDYPQDKNNILKVRVRYCRHLSPGENQRGSHEG